MLDHVSGLLKKHNIQVPIQFLFYTGKLREFSNLLEELSLDLQGSGLTIQSNIIDFSYYPKYFRIIDIAAMLAIELLVFIIATMISLYDKNYLTFSISNFLDFTQQEPKLVLGIYVARLNMFGAIIVLIVGLLFNLVVSFFPEILQYVVFIFYVAFSSVVFTLLSLRIILWFQKFLHFRTRKFQYDDW